MNNAIEHINIITALSEQITVLLNLTQACSRTINTAAEMAATMFDELMDEVNKWYEEDEKEGREND